MKFIKSTINGGVLIMVSGIVLPVVVHNAFHMMLAGPKLLADASEAFGSGSLDLAAPHRNQKSPS